jgi:hypothetical protein
MKRKNRSFMDDLKSALKEYYKKEGTVINTKKLNMNSIKNNIKIPRIIFDKKVIYKTKSMIQNNTKPNKKIKVNIQNIKLPTLNGSGSITSVSLIKLRDRAMKYFEKNPVIGLLQSQIQFQDAENGTNLYKEFNKMLKDKNITTSPPYYLELKYMWEDYLDEKNLRTANTNQAMQTQITQLRNQRQQTAIQIQSLNQQIAQLQQGTGSSNQQSQNITQLQNQIQQLQTEATNNRNEIQRLQTDLQNSEQENQILQLSTFNARQQRNEARQGWDAAKIAQQTATEERDEATQGWGEAKASLREEVQHIDELENIAQSAVNEAKAAKEGWNEAKAEIGQIRAEQGANRIQLANTTRGLRVQLDRRRNAEQERDAAKIAQQTATEERDEARQGWDAAKIAQQTTEEERDNAIQQNRGLQTTVTQATKGVNNINNTLEELSDRFIDIINRTDFTNSGEGALHNKKDMTYSFNLTLLKKEKEDAIKNGKIYAPILIDLERVLSNMKKDKDKGQEIEENNSLQINTLKLKIKKIEAEKIKLKGEKEEKIRKEKEEKIRKEKERKENEEKERKEKEEKDNQINKKIEEYSKKIDELKKYSKKINKDKLINSLKDDFKNKTFEEKISEIERRIQIIEQKINEKKIKNEILDRLKKNGINIKTTRPHYDHNKNNWYYHNKKTNASSWDSPLKERLFKLIDEYSVTPQAKIKNKTSFDHIDIDTEDDYNKIVGLQGIKFYEAGVKERKEREGDKREREKLAKEEDERRRKGKEIEERILNEKKKKADEKREIEKLKDELEKLLDKKKFLVIVRQVNKTMGFENKKKILEIEIKKAKEGASRKLEIYKEKKEADKRKQKLEIDKLLDKYEDILNELKKHVKINPKKNLDKIKKDITGLKNHEDKIKEINKQIKKVTDTLEKFKKTEKERSDAQKKVQIEKDNLKIVKEEFEDVVNGFLGVKEFGPTPITINSTTNEYKKIAKERIKKYKENQIRFIINNDKNIKNEIELINKDSIKIGEPEYGKKLNEWYNITKQIIQEIRREQELKEAKKNLPHGWDAVIDKKSNKIYFFNRKTNETSWKKPVAKVLGELGASPRQSRGSPRGSPKSSPRGSPRGSGKICQRGGKSITQALKDFANTNFRINRGFKADRIKKVQRFFKTNLVSFVNSKKLENLDCKGQNKRWQLKNIIVSISRTQLTALDYNGANQRKGDLSKTSGFENAFKELIKHISLERGEKLGYSEIFNYIQKDLGIYDTKKVSYLYREGEIESTSDISSISSIESTIKSLTDSSSYSDSVLEQKGGRKKIKGNNKINDMKYTLFNKLVNKNLI